MVEEGDTIEIDIPNRRIHLAVADGVLAERRAAMEAKGDAAWKPVDRERVISLRYRPMPDGHLGRQGAVPSATSSSFAQ